MPKNTAPLPDANAIVMNPSESPHHIDWVGAAERQAEIDKLLVRLERDKRRLATLLLDQSMSDEDWQSVRRVNASTNPYLARLWDEFLALPNTEQAAALSAVRFRGQHWQSLMQANPFCRTACWRDALEK